MNSEKWLVFHKSSANPKLCLFCFPYAGSGAMVFREWPHYVPREVDVCAVQPPGRENRFTEPPYTQVEPMVAALSKVVIPFLDKPFAFFGHSLGALIAFALARQLRKEHGILPLHLFVSGRSAPQTPKREVPFYSLPENDFIQKLRHLGGTEDNVLENNELMTLLVPLLRADFEVNENYSYTQEPALDCSISAFRGSKDDIMTYEDVAAWCEQTTSQFRLRTLPGGHFFINSAQTILGQILSYDLEQILVKM